MIYLVIDWNYVKNLTVSIHSFNPWVDLAKGKLCIHFYRLREIGFSPSVNPPSNPNSLSDKKQIKNTSKEFAEAWYNYKSQRSKNFFVRIKPFMTIEYYQATYDCAIRRSQDFTGQVPLQSHLISIEIISISQ